MQRIRQTGRLTWQLRDLCTALSGLSWSLPANRRGVSLSSTRRKNSELTSVPVDVKVVLLLEPAQALVQTEDDLLLGVRTSALTLTRKTTKAQLAHLVRAALERNALSLVVEAKPQDHRDLDALLVLASARAGLHDASDDGSSVERRRLTVEEARTDVSVRVSEKNRAYTHMKTSLSAWRSAASQAASCGLR